MTIIGAFLAGLGGLLSYVGFKRKDLGSNSIGIIGAVLFVFGVIS